ncbi:MAG: glycosyltransferase family A protein [Planctomycetota bacterium]
MQLTQEATATRRPPRVVLITPARDEARHLPDVVESIVAQTVRPFRWIIVDDGSTDGTAEVAADAARRHDWIRVLTLADRGSRVLGQGVIESFDAGLAEIEDDYDFLAKMDADVTVGPRYLARALELFRDDPRLGAVSGKVYRREGRREVEEFMIDEMVAGQWKLYRRACFEEIGGFVRRVMWDGIDFHTARMKGWKTRSVDDPELRILHHRLMGSSDRNVLVGRLRWGRGQWFLGSHPLYLFASAAWRARERPRVIGGLLILAGYALEGLKRGERYEAPGFRRELHRWQLKRIAGVGAGGIR